MNSLIFKRLLVLFFLFIFISFFSVPLANAEQGQQVKPHIGTQCKPANDKEGRSDDCEESSLEDANGDDKWFCDCDDDWDCVEEYGSPTDGGKWECIDDGPNDLDYCLSTKKQDVHLPVETENASVWDAIFDHQATRELTRLKAEGLKPVLSIRIPGLTFSDKITSSTDAQGRTILHIPYLAQYLAAIYKFGVAIVSIVAVAMMIQQGFAIIMSGGGEGKTEAYHRIGQIIVGLFILWSSYTILYIINPDLINLRTLDVQFVDREILSERTFTPDTGHAPVARPPSATAKLPKGKGDFEAANLLQCPELKPGTKFAGAFTSYLRIPAADYGIVSDYKGVYKGSDPSLKGMGDFFCEIAMECGCPEGKKNTAEGRMCITSKRTWHACKFFERGTEYCDACVGKWCHQPGQTIAASSCFPRGSQLKVGDRVVTVTDTGSGIVGTHFDLYLGVRGESNFVKDTSWLTTEIEVVSVGKPYSEKTLQRLRRAYNSYQPDICKPGYNC